MRQKSGMLRPNKKQVLQARRRGWVQAVMQWQNVEYDDYDDDNYDFVLVFIKSQPIHCIVLNDNCWNFYLFKVDYT